MRVQGFVIHLKRAVQRRSHVAALKQICPVPIEIIDAVDGATLEEESLRALYQPYDLFKPHYPFKISRGEIGCFLSHRKAWQAILDGGADAGLVFEDDAVLDQFLFPRALQAALGWMGRGDWVEFQTRPMHGTLIHEVDGFRIMEPRIPPLRLSAQLIGSEAAARMLRVTERFDRPVDTVLQLSGMTGQRVLCIEPSGVQDDTQGAGGTTIQKKQKSLWHQLRKSWHRAAYRRAVRAHVAAVRSRMD